MKLLKEVRMTLINRELSFHLTCSQHHSFSKSEQQYRNTVNVVYMQLNNPSLKMKTFFHNKLLKSFSFSLELE